ncbi:hypothetical protein F5B20DRAFT_593299 [Whalleya microplaca]|nr:hypothetical protein F5B20DRAFT_593299 [Whalleya microplaca]
MAPPNLVIAREAYAPPTLSTGAIVGIAIGGAIVIFAALAPLVFYIARRQDRRHAAAVDTLTGSPVRAQAGSPRRLRKKSLIAEPTFVPEVVMANPHSSLPVLPPVLSRPGSFTMGSFGGEGSNNGKGSGRNSADGRMQRPKSRSPEKQKGYDVYENRRKTSWIDEDALHGPRIASPKKAKRKASWLGTGLGRSLSRSLSFRKRAAELMASPTLPWPEAGFGKPTQSNSKGHPGNAIHDMHKAQTPMAPQPVLQQVAASPRKAYVHVSVPDPSRSPGYISRPPSNVIHNPRQRNSVALEAAEQLAGGARVPDPFTVNGPQTPGQVQRPPRMKQHATETELTEILRMTAERLQDGNRSARRQTMMVPGSGRSREDDYASLRGEPSYSGATSPAKSQKSAPAAIIYSELEGSSPAAQQLPVPTNTPRHTRQMSHVSMASMMSEPDSLVASRRGSQAEIQTALSSPSRAGRSTDPIPIPSPQGIESQQSRPYSTASSESSALSTLYSEEESSSRSPPISEMRLDRSPTDKERQAITKALSAYDTFNNRRRTSNRESQPSQQQPLEHGQSRSPQRTRKGTLGEIVPLAPRTLPSAPPADRKTPSELPNTRLSFTIHALDQHDDDPFVAKTPSPQPRLSKLFSPLPADQFKTPTPVVHVSEKTPTPSPTHRRVVLPPPQSLRAAASSPTLGGDGLAIERVPSPAVSEAGLSSVYDSYSYHDARAETETGSSSTATLITVPTASPSGRESRVGFRDPTSHIGGKSVEPSARKMETNRSPKFSIPVVRAPPSHRRRSSTLSAGSVYSQDQDELGPLKHAHPNTNTSIKSNGNGNNTHLTTATAVAELRRMNSAVSAVSGYSTATAAESPTLPALRGGGFSPGKKGGGARNYLALGTPSPSPPRGSSTRDSHSPGKKGAASGSPLRRGGVGRSRRGTVVGAGAGAELARVVLREGSGGNVGLKEGSGNGGNTEDGALKGPLLVTHAAKLVREEEAIARASIESLGLYDEKGFLRSTSPRRRDSGSPLSRL